MVVNKKNAVTFLRVCYWLGMVADAAAAGQLLIVFFKNIHSDTDPYLLQSTGIAFALMTGWTLLLFWADRKPLERRGVLLLTVLPVLFLLVLYRLILVVVGTFSLDDLLFKIVGAAVFMALFGIAYQIAGRYGEERTAP